MEPRRRIAGARTRCWGGVSSPSIRDRTKMGGSPSHLVERLCNRRDPRACEFHPLEVIETDQGYTAWNVDPERRDGGHDAGRHQAISREKGGWSAVAPHQIDRLLPGGRSRVGADPTHEVQIDGNPRLPMRLHITEQTLPARIQRAQVDGRKGP